MRRMKGKIFCITNFSTAYHQVVLTSETQKIVHFVVEMDEHKLKRGFY